MCLTDFGNAQEKCEKQYGSLRRVCEIGTLAHSFFMDPRSLSLSEAVRRSQADGKALHFQTSLFPPSNAVANPQDTATGTHLVKARNLHSFGVGCFAITMERGSTHFPSSVRSTPKSGYIFRPCRVPQSGGTGNRTAEPVPERTQKNTTPLS